MTIIISHCGPYDFYVQNTPASFRLHWGYFDLLYIRCHPAVAIPALIKAMDMANEP